MRLTLTPCAKYYFDEAAADRAVKFIESFCFHWEGEYAGKPFVLTPDQRQTTRDLFGWKHRKTGRRRFREMYYECSKGNGKSPWLAAIGLYMMIADNQAGAHIISAATDFAQANITFDFGKKMVPGHPRLAQLCEVKYHEILGPKNSKWNTVSGEPDGKHGIRPYCLLMDEAHEWPNQKLYDVLGSNAGKINESLTLIATNAGASKACFCWQLHERAEKVLRGKSAEETLYPVIYAAGKKDDPGSVETWRKANPSYDHIAALPVYLETEWGKARQNPSLMTRFRRLNLSQWVEGSNKWLDMAAWDECARGFKTSEVAKLPCYLGLDLSQNDDLSSLVTLWTGEDTWYLRQLSWIPGETARQYEEAESIPYSEWAEARHIRILREATINRRVKRRIARYILKLTERFDVRAVCYDRYKASRVVKLLEDRGVTCIPVKQSFELGAACQEIDRRFKERSLVVADDPCFRWQAANAEVIADKQGNVRLVKEAAKGLYKGRKSLKIDAIAATVNAVHQALREQEMGEEGGDGEAAPVEIRFY